MARPSETHNLKLILGLKVKHHRTEKGLSLKELASASGIATSYLSEIEQGRKYPKPDKIMQLAAGLGVPYDELVSLRVDARLDPLTTLMHSNLMREFPFELFGIEPRDILNLFSDAPAKATAFLQTFLEIGRTYDMSVENFLLASLRTYQKQHGNNFPAIEEAARSFAAARPRENASPRAEDLARILVEEFGYRIDHEALAPGSGLGEFRTVYRPGQPPVLHINPRLQPNQQAFALAREIGFRVLGIHQVRPETSTWVRAESFDHLIHNFQASYFAGALLLPRETLVPSLEMFLKSEKWSEETLRYLLNAHRATPEMFLYRMSQLLPGHFGLDQLFYLRFTRDVASGEVHLTKELNLTDELVPYGLGLREHYCRRWLPMQQLLQPAPAELKKNREPVIGGQRVRFLQSSREFLLVSMARPLSLTDARQSAMTIGFALDGDKATALGFATDPAIPFSEVHETCERCPLSREQCADRVVGPVIFEQQEAQRSREEALRRLRENDTGT